MRSRSSYPNLSEGGRRGRRIANLRQGRVVPPVVAPVVLESDQLPIDEVVGQDQQKLVGDVVDPGILGHRRDVCPLVLPVVLRLVLKPAKNPVPDGLVHNLGQVLGGVGFLGHLFHGARVACEVGSHHGTSAHASGEVERFTYRDLGLLFHVVEHVRRDQTPGTATVGGENQDCSFALHTAPLDPIVAISR
jgi:hypothetical protein